MLPTALVSQVPAALAWQVQNALAGLATALPLASGGAEQYSLPFVGPGTYLIFGIVLAPVYLMVLAWFLGEPSERGKSLLGLGYLVGITTALWGGLFVATMAIRFAFF